MGIELRDAKPSALDRFREAFAAELAEHPRKAPGPTALARRMGWSSPNMSGVYSKLRRELLIEAGFYQRPYPESAHWIKGPDGDNVDEVEAWLTE